MIDFSSSNVHWITQKESSHGWFQLDSVLNWYPSTNRELYKYILATAVPAGRMYANSGPLLKTPPYSFQLIAGQEEHSILRIPIGEQQSDSPNSSTQAHESVFKKIEFNLMYCNAEKLGPDSLAKLQTLCPTLNIVVEFTSENGFFEIQAPLRHWNYRNDPSGWQIETGPILWPKKLDSFNKEPNTRCLSPAWIHANQENLISISGRQIDCHQLSAKLSLLSLK